MPFKKANQPEVCSECKRFKKRGSVCTNCERKSIKKKEEENSSRKITDYFLIKNTASNVHTAEPEQRKHQLNQVREDKTKVSSIVFQVPEVVDTMSNKISDISTSQLPTCYAHSWPSVSE
jgi:hypothetical protein